MVGTTNSFGGGGVYFPLTPSGFPIAVPDYLLGKYEIEQVQMGIKMLEGVKPTARQSAAGEGDHLKHENDKTFFQ